MNEKMKQEKKQKKKKSVNQEGLPWYKYPWVWFIMALPASAVVAGFITLYIAHQNAPQVISKEHRFHINKE
jgi:hypothetical protein